MADLLSPITGLIIPNITEYVGAGTRAVSDAANAAAVAASNATNAAQNILSGRIVQQPQTAETIVNTPSVSKPSPQTVNIQGQNLPKPFISTSNPSDETPMQTSTPQIQSTPSNQYVYRSDPLAVALEGAVYLGDALTFGMFKPGAALLAEKGQVSTHGEYGAFSDWSAGAGQSIQRAFGQEPKTAQDFAAYEKTPEFINAGPVMQVGEGAYKVLATDPASIGASFLQGVEIYAGMGLLSAGLGVAAGAGGTLGQIGSTGQAIINSAAFQYGLGAALVAGTAISASDWGRNTPSQTMSNLGGAGVHLTAMGWGGYSPEILSFASRSIPVMGLTDTLAGRIGGNTYRLGGETGLPSSGGPGPTGEMGYSRTYHTELEDWIRPSEPTGPVGPSSPSGGRMTLSEPYTAAQVTGPGERLLLNRGPLNIMTAEERSIRIDAIDARWAEQSARTTTNAPQWFRPEPRAVMNPEQLLIPERTSMGMAIPEPMDWTGGWNWRGNIKGPGSNTYQSNPFESRQLNRVAGTPQRQMELKTIDLRPTIDLRETIDLRSMTPEVQMELQPSEPINLRTTKIAYKEPLNLNIPTQGEMALSKSLNIRTREEMYATPMERRMIIEQYGLTPAEIAYAKANKASLNDILSIRNQKPVFDVMQSLKTEGLTAYWQRPTVSHFSLEENALGGMSLSYARSLPSTARAFELTPEMKNMEAQDYSRMMKLSPDIAIKEAQDYARSFALAPIAITKTSTPKDYARAFDFKPAQDYSRPFALTPAVKPTPIPKALDIKPIPPTGLPGAGLFPWGGGGGGGGAGGKRHKRQLEIFSFDINSPTSMKNPFAIPSGGKKKKGPLELF